MITNFGLILALIVFFILKLLYNACIIIIVIALIAKFKAKGQEILNKKGENEDGEKR